MDHIEIDVKQIPDHVRDSLAKATLEFVQDLLSQPGGRELLEEKAAKRKEKQEAERKEKRGESELQS